MHICINKVTHNILDSEPAPYTYVHAVVIPHDENENNIQSNVKLTCEFEIMYKRLVRIQKN